MLTQLPRLTNSLRDHFDVDRAYLQRKELLRNIKSRRSRDDLELARRLLHRWDDVPSDVRQAYRQFLGSVRKLIDGEFSSDEFQEVAVFIYGLFSVPDIDIKRRVFEKKGELQKLVGYSAQDSSLQNAAELAHRLYMLQRDDHESESTWKGIADGCGDDIEFGSDLAFKVPARFHVGVPLENGATSWGDGFKSEVPHERQLLMQAHHALNVERKVMTLRMLKDECEWIVDQRSSPLSGDDLAMALCRILLSKKAGDEIAADLLDLVGDGAFKLVQDLLSHRKELVDTIQHGLFILKSEKTTSNGQARMPSYGTQKQLYRGQMDTLRRKEEKRYKRGMDQGGMQDIPAGSFSSLLIASEKMQPFDDLVGTGQGPGSFSLTSLPQGTTRFYGSNYEGVRIPPAATVPLGPDEKLELLNFPRIKVKVNLQKNDAEDSASGALNIILEKLNHKHTSSRAFVPRFPKVKDEAWWLVLGNVATSELYALKRVSFSDRMVTRMGLPSTQVDFQETKLLLISDCYIGLDQQHSIEQSL